MPAEELTISVEVEGADEATEALEELADAAERANEALEGLTVRVSSGRDNGREAVVAVAEEFRSRGGDSGRME